MNATTLSSKYGVKIAENTNIIRNNKVSTEILLMLMFGFLEKNSHNKTKMGMLNRILTITEYINMLASK